MSSTPSIKLRLVDSFCLAVAMAIALSPLVDVWSDRQWILTAVIGLGLALGITLLAQHLRWGPLLTMLAVAVGYLLVGPAAAAPEQAAVGVFPTPDAARTLVVGLVESWKTVLTLPLPLGATRGELVVPFVLALLGGVIATTLLWRSRWPGGAPLAVVACFVVAAAFGAQETTFPVLRGLLLVVVLLLWSRWRSMRGVRTPWRRRVAMGSVVVAVAGLIGWGLTAAVAGDDREVLRDHIEPPLAELDLKSPLARFRDYYKSHENDVLFTFDNLPAGDPYVRLASMDAFDGLVWNVATEDLATGSSAFRPAPAAQRGSAVEVTVESYVGVWVPTVGTATAVTLADDAGPGWPRTLLLNPATGAVAMAGEAQPGDRYRIDWAPRPERSNELYSIDADRRVNMPAMTAPTIEKLDQMTQRWIAEADATSDYERALALEQGFRDHGYHNDGLAPESFGYSASGHGIKRLADLVQDEDRMVGNDEQYASAMAYAAQRTGLPARVVLGFDEIRSDGTVRGGDIAAWVEIAFADYGWVPFDPTPPEDRTPPPLSEENNPVPQPYVVQPPVIPQEPEDVHGVPPEGAGKELSEDAWDVLWLILGYLWRVLQVLLLLLPVWLVLAAKGLRRRRRRRAADPLVRLSGGWREVTDRARDLGTRMPPGHTRSECSAVLAGRFGAAAPAGLAATADRHIFGPGLPTEEEVSAYWEDVDSALRRMRQEVPWWRRWWAALSPASLPWRAVAAWLAAVPRKLASTLPWRGRDATKQD